jgi:hypothetical protein
VLALAGGARISLCIPIGGPYVCKNKNKPPQKKLRNSIFGNSIFVDPPGLVLNFSRNLSNWVLFVYGVQLFPVLEFFLFFGGRDIFNLNLQTAPSHG